MKFNISRQEIINENNIRRLGLVPSRKLNRILDLGCAEGDLSKMIKDKTRGEVYGLDISREKCRLAAKKGIITLQADINRKIPFRENFFDLVFAGAIIEHLLNPDFFLEEIRRVLKNNGFLILTTPNLASWHNRLLLLFGIQPYGLEVSTKDARMGFKFFKKIKNPEPAGHLRIFTLGAMKDLLEKYGFRLEKIKGCPTDYFLYPFRLLEKFFSLFPSLSTSFIIRAMNKK